MDSMKQILNYFRFRLLCYSYILYIELVVVILSLICIFVSVALFTCLPVKSAVNRASIIPLNLHLNQELERQYKKITEDKRRERLDLVQKRLRLQHSIQQENVYFENMKPAAKLIGTGETNSTHCDTCEIMNPIKRWLQGQEHYHATGFMRFGVKQCSGRIVVPLTGTYVIYAHAQYNLTKDTWCVTDQSDNTFFRHEIYRYNVLDDHMQVLVADEKRSVLMPSDAWEIVGSYIFTIADLRAGDELTLRVNNLNHISHSFFGLNHI